MNKSRIITVALAGNPNSGKTSLFNLLVGSNQKVGNFSGVTVEKVEGTTRHKDYLIKITDLPGTYSLTAYSPEEVLARNFIINNSPDIVVNVVDSSNIERNLYLTTQLMEFERNFIISLNMFDELRKQQVDINVPLLETLLGTSIIPTSARYKQGIEELLDRIVDIYEGKFSSVCKISYQEEIESRVNELTRILSQDQELTQKYPPKWLAIKLLENDKLIYTMVKDHPVWIKAVGYLLESNSFIESNLGEEPEILITQNRHSFIKGALKEALRKPSFSKKSFTEILDIILINRITGIPVFFFFMWLIFQMVFKVGEYPMLWIESFFGWMGVAAGNTIENETIRSIVQDGIISGVGGVLVFLPNIMLLFLALAFLEGTGYMARAAFVVDKIMHVFGLHGKSAISMITGFGCSVPAFMSTRTLKNKSDRITTLLIIPFMSCGAKLPVYILIIGAFFTSSAAGNVLFGIYLFGIMVALLSAMLFKSTIFRGESEPFVMELPPYRLPSLRSLIYQMWHKASLYLKKAATIILLASVIIWLGTNFPESSTITKDFQKQSDQVMKSESFNPEEKEVFLYELSKEEAGMQMQFSIIGRIGIAIEPFLSPLGFDWKLGVSLLSGIAGKEIVVSTMATLFSLGEGEDTGTSALQVKLRNHKNYTMATAIAFLIFVLLYVPCIAATTVFHREAQKWRWTLLYVSYSTGLAWILAFAGYQITSLFL